MASGPITSWQIDGKNANRGSESTQRDGMGREMGGRFKRKGVYVYLWLIHVEFDRKQQNFVKQLSFNKEKNILKNK